MIRNAPPYEEICEPRRSLRLAAGDPLAKYKQKREFGETPEPEGKDEKSDNKHRFVIQRHKAKKAGEHFDLRLENDEGAMSSWSIPKHHLPSGKEKLLAVKTEDHPLEYRTFEGTIPEGEYGAGEVEIYDSGTYDDIEWGKTKIVFQLKGKKEKGTYKLFRTDGKSWMIMADSEQKAEDRGSDAVGLNEELVVAFILLRRALQAFVRSTGKAAEDASSILSILGGIREAFPSARDIDQDVHAQPAIDAAFRAGQLADKYGDPELKSAADRAFGAVMKASEQPGMSIDIPFANDGMPISSRAMKAPYSFRPYDEPSTPMSMREIDFRLKPGEGTMLQPQSEEEEWRRQQERLEQRKKPDLPEPAKAPPIAIRKAPYSRWFLVSAAGYGLGWYNSIQDAETAIHNIARSFENGDSESALWKILRTELDFAARQSSMAEARMNELLNSAKPDYQQIRRRLADDLVTAREYHTPPDWMPERLGDENPTGYDVMRGDLEVDISEPWTKEVFDDLSWDYDDATAIEDIIAWMEDGSRRLPFSR